MSIRFLLTSPLLVLASLACTSSREDPAVQVSTSDPELHTRWHATVASPSSLAGAVQMRGSATMEPGADGTSTLFTVELSNASPGGVHPWAAHRGQCGSGMDGGVLGSRDAYKPLAVNAEGRATATATVPMHTPVTGSYFIAVRASEANYETIVACGNLAPPTR